MLARSKKGAQIRHVCATRGKDAFGIELYCKEFESSGMLRAPVVSSLEESSVLARAGLRFGDTVLAVHGLPPDGANDATRLLRETEAGSQVMNATRLCPACRQTMLGAVAHVLVRSRPRLACSSLGVPQVVVSALLDQILPLHPNLDGARRALEARKQRI